MKTLLTLFLISSSTLLFAFNDLDGDGIEDSLDNCVNTYNPLQLDTNNDGIGDACDTLDYNADCVFEYIFTEQYEISRLIINGQDVNEMIEPIQGFELAFRSGDDPYIAFLEVLASITNTEIGVGVWFKNDYNGMYPSEEDPITLVFSKEYVQTIDIDFDFNVDVETFTKCREVLSVDNIDKVEYNLSIFPNPSSDYINIDSNESISNISVYNILGQEVIKTKETQININSLTSGVYIVAVDFLNSRITKRILKN